MKKIIFAVIAISAFAFGSVAPAFAGYSCVSYQGRTICCSTMGNYTYCS